MNVNQICDLISGSTEKKNGLSNADLVQIIEHTGGYLNLKTIPEYAKENGISYNGAKKFRTVRKIFNVKFVIDND
ncbi:MAG: hypothetical protein ABIN48_05045 [Ginsengibacter sp.]